MNFLMRIFEKKLVLFTILYIRGYL